MRILLLLLIIVVTLPGCASDPVDYERAPW